MNQSEIRAALLDQGINYISVNLFLAWHNQRPEIWHEFERLALEAISKGVSKWGAKGVAEVVRWNLKVAKKGDYRLNNNWPAYYARVFILKHPEHAGFFELRRAEGLQEAA